MPRIDQLRPAFVDTMPEKLEDGIIYISEECRVALHNCCCGCGEEVSTPLGPTEFTLGVHGGRVTVWPSIGNHDYPCRSHYMIERNSIIWADPWSREAVEAGRALDRRLKRGDPKRSVPARIIAWVRSLVSYFRPR